MRNHGLATIEIESDPRSEARSPGARRALAKASALDTPPFVETAAFRRMIESDARLILIAAPPGFGKTSLLRALADAKAAQSVEIAWCDSAPTGNLPEEMDTAGVSVVRPGYVLVDDAHEADPRRLARLLRNICASEDARRYVIATRTLPEIDWLSLELSGRVELFRIGDLALAELETASCLELYSGLKPSAEQVRQIHALTEGWPVAARLCGMIARRAGSWAALTSAELRPRADLGRYLNERVYADLDDAMRGFLLFLADFDRFSVPMLSAIIGAPAAALLQRALLENAMLMPARGGENWFRLHGIFQEFLVDKKRQAGASVDAPLLMRASDWCARHGAAGDAVECAMRAGEYQAAHDLLLDHAPTLVQQAGELPRILDWVARLDRAGHPVAIPLRLWKTWALTFTLRLDAANEELALIDRTWPADAPASWRAHFDKIHISIASRRDDMPTVVRLSAAWLECWRQTDPFQAAAVGALRALAHFQCFEEAAQRRDLCAARQSVLDADSLYAEMWILVIEAIIELHSGRARLALDHVEAGLCRARAVEDMSPSMVATLCLIAARLQAETGNMAEARRLQSLGHASLNQTGLIESDIAALETKVLLIERERGADAALTELRQIPVKAVRLVIAAKLLAVQILLRAGRGAEAVEILDATFVPVAEGYRLVATGEPLADDYVPDVRHAEAWVALGSGDSARALALAGRLLPHAEAHGRARRHVALLLLSASAHLVADRQGDARRCFIRAIRMAAEGGLFQTVVDHSWALRPLIALDIDAAELGDRAAAFLAELRVRLDIVALDGGGDAYMAEALTAREQEVLNLLDSGLTSQRLADRMNLSLSTAKWHMQNIYNKLDVRNRSGALAKARRMALL